MINGFDTDTKPERHIAHIENPIYKRMAALLTETGIAKNFVLTAAHCVHSSFFKLTFKIEANVGSTKAASGNVHFAKEVFIQEGFNERTSNNDLEVL